MQTLANIEKQSPLQKSKFMEYQEAGQRLKTKRKQAGFKTQRALIAALQQSDPAIHCSETYLSLIESGQKSPSVHLLDLMALVLGLSAQDKGELLLLYKRVPSDLEFAVRSNLAASLQQTNLERLQQAYQNQPDQTSFNKLVRALILSEQSQEALTLLKTAPHFSGDVIEYQDRTAQMAAIASNYPFAVQAFELALSNTTEPIQRSDLLMKMGMTWFMQGLHQQYSKPLDALHAFLQGMEYLQQSLTLCPNGLYALDEYARCCYHVGDALDYCIKNDILPGLTEFQEKPHLQTQRNHYYQLALQSYSQVLCHAEQQDLPEKALKEAVFFHAYTQAKLGQWASAQVALNSLLILERNWLTCFMRAGYAIMHYEATLQSPDLEDALAYLALALEYEPDTIRWLLLAEQNRELKTLWHIHPKKMAEWSKEPPHET